MRNQKHLDTSMPSLDSHSIPSLSIGEASNSNDSAIPSCVAVQDRSCTATTSSSDEVASIPSSGNSNSEGNDFIGRIHRELQQATFDKSKLAHSNSTISGPIIQHPEERRRSSELRILRDADSKLLQPLDLPRYHNSPTEELFPKAISKPKIVAQQPTVSIMPKTIKTKEQSVLVVSMESKGVQVNANGNEQLKPRSATKKGEGLPTENAKQIIPENEHTTEQESTTTTATPLYKVITVSKPKKALKAVRREVSILRDEHNLSSDKKIQPPCQITYSDKAVSVQTLNIHTEQYSPARMNENNSMQRIKAVQTTTQSDAIQYHAHEDKLVGALECELRDIRQLLDDTKTKASPKKSPCLTSNQHTKKPPSLTSNQHTNMKNVPTLIAVPISLPKMTAAASPTKSSSSITTIPFSVQLPNHNKATASPATTYQSSSSMSSIPYSRSRTNGDVLKCKTNLFQVADNRRHTIAKLETSQAATFSPNASWCGGSTVDSSVVNQARRQRRSSQLLQPHPPWK